MYTQCPECTTAFRVTAEILRQAAGKVRCGGCGNAFNALMYLSETRPEAPARKSDDESALPELRPEDEGRDAISDEPPPRAISPEQSDALLETLDELSGENVRLEDTGIEWRVLPEDDDDDTGSAEDLRARSGRPVDADISGDAGASRVDELLEDSPTPVDEFLTATPHDLDAPEVFAEGDDKPAGALEASEVFEDAAGEMRFDDNTGLPDDFDFDNDASPQPAAQQREAEADPAPEAAPQPDPLQVDIAFGDPDEWGALLDEVDDGAVDEAPQVDEAAPRAAETATGAARAAEAGDDAEILDLDTQFGLQAKALGIREQVGDPAGVAVDEDADDPVASGETDGFVLEDDERDSYEDDASAAGEEDAEDDSPTSIDEDLYRAAFEAEEREDAIPIPESTGELESELARARAAYEDALGDDDGESMDESLEALLEPDFDDVSDGDEDMPSAIHDLELELDGDAASPASDDDDDFDLVAERSDGDQRPTILPMSDEEQTINQMIDEDMLRMAVEEDDGLSSSMVLKALDIEAAAAAGKGDDDTPTVEDDDAPAGVGVETIIMEGEFVRTALEEQALAEQALEDRREEESREPEEPARNRVVSALKSTMQGRANEEAPADGSRRRYGLVAGVGVLTLLLVGQLVHQSRAELATIPALNGIIAPIYRTLGAPITPQWDVTGWRFEITRGSTNAAALADELAEDGRGVDFGGAATGDPEVLTIYSRIGNQAEQPLPYPLVSVSLTDRFEEIIGSKVLSPNDYLTGDFDPRRLVPPGETFNAVITIESPAAEATGFKLNVCYRETGDRLRCAIEDFL